MDNMTFDARPVSAQERNAVIGNQLSHYVDQLVRPKFHVLYRSWSAF